MGSALAAHKQYLNSRATCRKMCRSNTCKKLHFVQKIKQVQIVRPFGASWHFLRIAQFSAAIEAAHFPAETTRPLGPRLSAIFTSYYIEAIKPYDVSGWIFCRRLFLPPKIGGLFLFLKGVARQGRALE